MLEVTDKIILGVLVLSCLILTFLLNVVLNKKSKKGLDRIFVIIFLLLIFWLLSEILQLVFVKLYGINPIYFDYFSYISVCFLPVAFFFMTLIFEKTKIQFKKRYILIFIVPTLSLLILWTNDIHHLFYEVYSKIPSEAVFGKYFNIHLYYTYILFGISIISLMRYSIKNAGFFSKQAILILVGSLIPIIMNVLMIMGILTISPYITPITFTFTIAFYSMAIFKFNLFKATPIALQRIVDRISDSYITLNDNYTISDYNKTFITTFQINGISKIRGTDLEVFLKRSKLDIDIYKINTCIEKVRDNDKTEVLSIYVKEIKKHFNVEISSIIDNRQFLGILILFKDITQHIEDMKNLKENQTILLEKERLATLGQMIGGVAHNLKTPIMSISGATEGLEDLVKEYEKSVGDPEVTIEDHHGIASDMMNWITKIRSYNNYMSDIITAVKGQAVSMNENQNETFTIEELLSRVNILMRHELKAALVAINEDIKVSKNTKIHGNVNSLVQVVDNLITNSIYAYGPADSIQQATVNGSSFVKGNGADFGSGKAIGQTISEISTNRIIDLIICKKSDNIVISITDYGSGMTEEVKNKLFKQMITTKGHNGSGLGLFMSYSTIKGNFQGDMNFTSELGKGTTFNIILPCVK